MRFHWRCCWRQAFLTGDNDDTVEGAHLNDLGAHRMGESCARLLKSILKL